MRLLEKEFADLRTRLYPLMMDPAQIPEKGQGQMLHGEIAEGLHVIYGIEEPGDKIRYVTMGDLTDWGVSHTTVHVTAIRNLEELTEGKRVNKLDRPEGGRPMFIWNLQDGYDAARCLLPKWLNEFAAVVPGQLLVGAPHRNWMVAIGNEDDELVEAVRRRVAMEHKAAGFPVSPHLYYWNGQKLEQYRG